MRSLLGSLVRGYTVLSLLICSSGMMPACVAFMHTEQEVASAQLHWKALKAFSATYVMTRDTTPYTATT
jgi:hypothetical protein